MRRRSDSLQAYLCQAQQRDLKTIAPLSHRPIVLTDTIDYRTIVFLHYRPNPRDYQRKLHLMYHIYLLASWKWTKVIMCLKFTYLRCYTAMRVWNDSRRWRSVIKSDANLIWLDLWHYRCCGCARLRSLRAGGGHFEHMIWNECSFIQFIPTFVWNWECNLMHVG